MPTVRAHAAQDGARAAYGARLDVFYGLQRREALAYSLYAATTTFLPSCVAAAVLFYGGSLVLCGRMSPGALVAFMLYQQSLSGAFSTMGDVFSALSAAVGAADKVIELMRREPALPPPGGLAPAALEGAVEFRGVKFSYPSRPGHTVLDGLWFSVRPGEVVALVGPSGGGKSSVIKLLQRFYDPDEGSVLIDGRPVACYDPKWLVRERPPQMFCLSVVVAVVAVAFGGGWRCVFHCDVRCSCLCVWVHLDDDTQASHLSSPENTLLLLRRTPSKPNQNSDATWRSSRKSPSCSPDR